MGRRHRPESPDSAQGPQRHPQMAFSPDGKRLAGVLYSGFAKLWDMASGKETLTFTGFRGLGVQCMTFSPDGKRLACAGARSLRQGFGSYLSKYSSNPVRNWPLLNFGGSGKTGMSWKACLWN